MLNLQVGDRILDNDPRVTSDGFERVLTIANVYDDTVYASDGSRVRKYDRARIFPPGKPRRSGFTLLPRETTESATQDASDHKERLLDFEENVLGMHDIPHIEQDPDE